MEMMLRETIISDERWNVYPIQVNEGDSPTHIFSEIGRSLYDATEPSFIVSKWKELCFRMNVDPLSIGQPQQIDFPQFVWDQFDMILSNRLYEGLTYLDNYLSVHQQNPLILSRACALAQELLSAELPDKNVELYSLVCLYRRELVNKVNTIIDRHDQSTNTIKVTLGKNRLKWKASTNAFVHVFNTLAAQGYFELPSKGGKQGEMNNTEFARLLLEAFDVNGSDAENLRRRMAGAGRSLVEYKAQRFQIPAANELIIPPASEME
jgi:hypothetical protein